MTIAILKQRMLRMTSPGTYSTVHLETSASCVMLENGTNVEQALKQKANTTHNHNANDIASGVLPAAYGGTGATSIASLKTLLGITDGLKFDCGVFTPDSNGRRTITLGFTIRAAIVFRQYYLVDGGDIHINISVVLPGHPTITMNGINGVIQTSNTVVSVDGKNITYTGRMSADKNHNFIYLAFG